MFVDTSKLHRNGKTYVRHLLRSSYRENGKVKHRTHANLSHCSPEEIAAIKLALRHKHDLAALGDRKHDLTLQQGSSVGAAWLLHELARDIGIVDALGTHRDAGLALWQIIARVLDQGSRLSAVRLAGTHAACEVLGLSPFDEDDLYRNLDWMAGQQDRIETRWGQRQTGQEAGLFLYDVTLSYLEGEHNELSAFGYNRDGKRGRKQVVIGLLCAADGRPLSIEVFPGNTRAPATFAAHVDKVAERFSVDRITFVGDRGMIESRQIDNLAEHGFHFITAITRPRIEALIGRGVLQLELLDTDLAEVETEDGLRYVIRRNSERVAGMAASREDRYRVLVAAVAERNRYLAEHPRARPGVAAVRIGKLAEKLRIATWVGFSEDDREIRLEKREQEVAEIAGLDGCHVLETDLGSEIADKDLVHRRYKDLALVEAAFRDDKTVDLEVQPIHVRKESRTRGHALVVMFAHALLRELRARWNEQDMTVAEGLDQCADLCATHVHIRDDAPYLLLPKPRPAVLRLFDAARLSPPETLPSRAGPETTGKKLPKRRKVK